MEYISRIVDDVIDRKTEAFNAVSITGPKGCGKTRTARERCKTVIEFQDEDKREGYLAVAETAPKLFLKNPKPILFDEWQDAPKIWGTIRKACDDNPESVGEFYLTGSSSKKINTPHTGTGRITEVTMYPMTLFETGESNGSISLFKLLEDEAYDIDGLTTDIKLEDLFFAVCRGGWPRCMALSKDSAKLEIAKDYYRQIYQKDISAIDGVNRIRNGQGHSLVVCQKYGYYSKTQEYIFRCKSHTECYRCNAFFIYRCSGAIICCKGYRCLDTAFAFENSYQSCQKAYIC